MNGEQSFAQADVERGQLIEIGLGVREQVNGRAFWNRPEFYIAIRVGKRLQYFGDEFLPQMDVTFILGPLDRRFAETLFRPEELFDGVVKCFQAARDRRIAGKLTERVIMQEGRRAPKTNE